MSQLPLLTQFFLLAMNSTQGNSFSGRDCENPYHHLRKFEQVCSCKKISGMTHETLKWKLFPFSLSGEAKQWYIRVVGGVNGSWIELREYAPYKQKFLLSIRMIRNQLV